MVWREDPVAAADGRGAAGGVDRHRAAPAAGRESGVGDVGGVGVCAVDQGASQVKLTTLIALCTALDCTPNDLLEVDATPVEQPVTPSRPAPVETKKTVNTRGRSMPPM